MNLLINSGKNFAAAVLWRRNALKKEGLSLAGLPELLNVGLAKAPANIGRG